MAHTITLVRALYYLLLWHHETQLSIPRSSGIRACIISYSGAAALTVFATAYLHYLNKKNEARRVAAGKSAKIIDYSMSTTANEKDGICSPEGSNIGRRAFEDLTDLENEEFIVSCNVAVLLKMLTSERISSTFFRELRR